MKQDFGSLSYLSQLKKTPWLNAAQEKELTLKARAGSKRAKNKLISANLKLVVKIAASFICRELPLQDMISEGNIGLMHAVDKFDPSRGYRFATYARWWVMSYIRRALTNHVATIRISSSMIAFISRWKQTSLALTNELGREPYYDEIIARLKPSTFFLSIIKRLLRSDYSNKYNIMPSIVSSELKNILDPDAPAVDGSLMTQSDKKLIKSLMTRISAKEALILNMLYGLDHKKPPLSLKKTAGKLKLSAEYIRIIEKRALRKMQLAWRQKK
jgi:RNA polymerase primary sigma factor